MDLAFIGYLKIFFLSAAVTGVGMILFRFFFKSVRNWLGWAIFSFGVLTALFGLAGFVLLKQADRLTGTARIKQKAPDFDFRLVEDDRRLSLADYKDKVILLNFWATWCSPCREEMPHLERLHQQYRDRGFVVLAISDEDGETVREYWQENDFTMIGGYLNAAGDADLPELFQNIVGRPTTFIIGRDGEIKKVIVGASDFETFENAIKGYL